MDERCLYDIDRNADVCQFNDKYITCAIPVDEGQLRDSVAPTKAQTFLLLQA